MIEPRTSAQRQADKSRRMKARGYVRLGIWIPGDVHEHVKREANRLGIPMQDMVIRKLRK